MQIFEWFEIKDDFGDILLIGNGASIAVSEKFKYDSINRYARDYGYLTEDISNLFDYFKTDNFEFILKLVWQANNVNKALNIIDSKTSEAYSLVRRTLIEIVRAIHPSYSEVEGQLPNISSFIKNFRTIFSLNYDLILYWAMMYGNNESKLHSFKDCFISSSFDLNWKKYRKPIPPARNTTLVFYLHGSLILASNVFGEEEKISLRGGSENLLEYILSRWETEKVVPLFVSEGTKKMKMRSIINSSYLNNLHNNILPLPNNCLWSNSNIVIYGWSFSKNDLHILERMFSNKLPSFCKKIAISVRNHNIDYCEEVTAKIKKINSLSNIELIFFNSSSNSCWNN